MKRYFFIVLTVILIGGLILTSCSTSTTSTTTSKTAATTSVLPTTSAPPMTTSKAPASSTTTTTSTAAPTTSSPQYGGTLKIIASAQGIMNLGYPGKPAAINDPILFRAAVETLVTFDPQGTGKIVPLLATSWQISPDYKSITFNLRKGVKFHDGTDFNAQAAKYCLDLFKAGSSTQGYLKSVASVDVVDDYTIRLNISDYDAALLTNLSLNAGWMVSPTALKQLGDNAIFHPVGTGPFKFGSYQNNVSLTFDKFDGYWQKGKPYLDHVQWIFIADAVTALASFKAGEAQADRWLTPKDAIDLQKTGKYTFVQLPSSINGMISDSAHTDTPFANIKVRQAISYAMDIEAIAKSSGYGLEPATNQLAVPTTPGYNPAVVGYPYNPQKASQLLSEAGYPKGFQTSILYPSDYPTPDTWVAVQAYLANVGISAKLDAADPPRFFQVTASGWHNELAYFGLPLGIGRDPANYMTLRLSSTSPSYDPKSVYIPDDYTTLLNQARTERDPDQRQLKFQQLQKMIIDQYCMVTPFFLFVVVLGKNNTVHDLDLGTYGFEWLPENAWLSK